MSTAIVDSALLRVNLFDCYNALLKTLQDLCAALRQDSDLPCWVSRSEQEFAAQLDMRDKAISLYQSLWYEDGQDGRETLTCPGIVGVSPTTLAAAQISNDAKDRFKQAVLALKALNGKQANALMNDLHSRDQDVALSMRRMGAARLNLKQAYRHVPLLNQRPEKLSFTWSKQGRTIQRTTVAEARRLLERRSETPEVAAALRRLADIPESEILARVRATVPHLRANIVHAERDQHDAAASASAEPQRRLMQTPLPVIIPLQPGEPLPQFVPIPPEPGGQVRVKRSDVKIADEAFIPLIRIHRYLPAYRTGVKS